MDVTIPVEDHRGVDVARIRELLSMTAQERVQHMLTVVAVVREKDLFALPYLRSLRDVIRGDDA